MVRTNASTGALEKKKKSNLEICCTSMVGKSEGTAEKAAFLNAMSEEWGTNLSTETSFRIASVLFFSAPTLFT